MPPVNGARVRQAREIQSLTQQELADRLGVSQPHISLIEQGVETPSDSLLTALALTTGFPPGFFSQATKGPDFPLGSLLYRKSRNLSSPDAAHLRQSARLMLEVLQRLAGRYKRIPVGIPRVGSGNPIEAAHVARSVLGASPDEPITGIVRRLEKAGVFVFLLPTTVKDFDAFSAWSDEDERRPVICLRHGAPGDRFRFTVSEELGHLMMHQDFLGAPRELDKEARIFAGEFLFPEEEMKEGLRLPITLTHLAELKAQWGVSMQAILYLAEQRELISARQKQYVIGKLRKRGWYTDEPVHIPAETPRLWRQMAEGAFGAPIDHRRLAGQYEVSPTFVQHVLAANRPTDQQTIAPSAGSPSVLRFSPSTTN